MIVTVKTRSIEKQEEYDYRNKIEILVNNKVEFKVQDGDSEDNNLSREFSDCYKIDKLMEMAYLAGMNNESFEINYIED